MAVQTPGATKTSTTPLARIGLVATVLSAVALAIPLLYALFAAVTGDVTLATADDIAALFTRGIIISGVAVVLGLVALGFNLPAVFGTPRRALVTTASSAVVLVVSGLLLFAVVLPRANAVSHLNSDVVPFAEAMRDDCKVPLNAISADLAKARDDAQANNASDAGFVSAMQADAAQMTADTNTLSLKLAALETVHVPEAKYQSLKADCVTAVTGQIAFMTDASGPNAIALPAPFSQKVAGIQLLQLGAAVASGKGPVQLPPGTTQAFMYTVLNQVIQVSSASPFAQQLAAEGNQLTQDIQDTLANTLAPFKSSVPVK